MEAREPVVIEAIARRESVGTEITEAVVMRVDSRD